MLTITEAERKVLIALIELCDPIETPNNSHYTFYPKTLEDAATYFRSLREDWAPAYVALEEKGLLSIHRGCFQLTDAGASAARQERLDHPPIWYWYREYYLAVQRSRVYAQFCEQLYGRDLSQTNFSDMQQLDFLIERANPKPTDRVLDLGCGNGRFAEYLSDRTGACARGIDYIPEAVAHALERTKAKRDRLQFQVGNFDHLDFPQGSFDLLTAIDTLYMPNDLPASLSKMWSILAPGGRMLVFYSQFCFDPNQPRESLLPDGSTLAQALQLLGLTYRAWDFTEATFHLLRRKHRLAQSMRSDFETEGTLFLYDHLMMESDSGEGPFDPSSISISRYLYEITKDSQ